MVSSRLYPAGQSEVFNFRTPRFGFCKGSIESGNLYNSVVEQLRSFARSHRRQVMNTKKEAKANGKVCVPLVPHTLLVFRSECGGRLLGKLIQRSNCFFFAMANSHDGMAMECESHVLFVIFSLFLLKSSCLDSLRFRLRL